MIPIMWSSEISKINIVSGARIVISSEEMIGVITRTR